MGFGYTDRKRANFDVSAFDFREKRLTIAGALVPPPVDWQIPFRTLAEECGLPTEVAAVFAAVQQFLDEVRVGRPDR
jgi:hypothetical protein